MFFPLLFSPLFRFPFFLLFNNIYPFRYYFLFLFLDFRKSPLFISFFSPYYQKEKERTCSSCYDWNRCFFLCLDSYLNEITTDVKNETNKKRERQTEKKKGRKIEKKKKNRKKKNIQERKKKEKKYEGC